LFLFFASLAWVVGGSFFYFRPSLTFISGSIGTPNIFRDPTYSWLPTGVWLVFPTVVLIGAAILLGRARTRALLRQDRVLLWSQIQFLILLSVMLFLQVAGDSAVLQHFYYASLLIPAAFLAFAGQVATLVPGLPRQRFAVVAAAVALLQIVPPFVPLIDFLAYDVFPAPALLALSAGLAVAAAVWLRVSGRRAILAVFLGLAISQLVVRQAGTIFRQFERHGGDGRGLYSQLTRAVRAIEAFDPSHDVRLWYDYDAEDGVVYDAVASAFLLCPRMINLGFPDLPDARMCDGAPLGPGVPIAILSADPSAFEKADAALRGVGLSARLLGREVIPGPSRGFTITYLRSAAGAAP